MSKIKIGTASWNDRVSIYPSWCTSPEDKLRMYSSEFPTVEVDGSYYAIPAPSTTDAWARFTPEDFQFNVKAYRLLICHHTQPKSLPIESNVGFPRSWLLEKASITGRCPHT